MKIEMWERTLVLFSSPKAINSDWQYDDYCEQLPFWELLEFFAQLKMVKNCTPLKGLKRLNNLFLF